MFVRGRIKVFAKENFSKLSFEIRTEIVIVPLAQDWPNVPASTPLIYEKTDHDKRRDTRVGQRT